MATTNTFYSFDAITPSKERDRRQGTIVTGISSTGDISGYSISGYSTDPPVDPIAARIYARRLTARLPPSSGDNTGMGAVLGNQLGGVCHGGGGWIEGGDGFVSAADGTGSNFDPLLFTTLQIPVSHQHGGGDHG